MIITSASTRLGLGSELDNFVMIFKLTGWKISVWHSEGCKVWKQTSPNSESTANFKAKEKQNTKKQKFGSCVSKSQKILWTINFVKYRKINLSSHFSLKTLDLILCHVTVAQGGHNVFQCHKNVNFCNNFVGLTIADDLKSKIGKSFGYILCCTPWFFSSKPNMW